MLKHLQKIIHFFTKRKKTYLKLGVSLIVLTILFYLYNPLYRVIEWILVCETPFQPADIIRLDGTGGQLRKAVELYEDNLVQGILINANVPERYNNVDEPICEFDFVMEDLLEAGVPEQAIYQINCEGSSLLEKQRCFRDWMYENNFTSYMVQTSRLHTCLNKYIHQDTFPNGDITLVMLPSNANVPIRKQIVNIHNTLVYMLYWHYIYRPQLQNGIQSFPPTSSSLEPFKRTPFNTPTCTLLTCRLFHG